MTLMVDNSTDTLLVNDTNTGSKLRVAHTISDAPGVDVWINGSAPKMNRPLYKVEFKGFTGYLDVALAIIFLMLLSIDQILFHCLMR